MNVIALKKTYLPTGKPAVLLMAVIGVTAISGAYILSISSNKAEFKSGAQRAASAVIGQISTTEDDNPKAMNVANNGLILLRGARIISVESDAIVAEVKWGSQNFIWNIKTERNTKFIQNGEKTTIEELRIGDVGTITGDLDTDEREPTVIADYVRF